MTALGKVPYKIRACGISGAASLVDDRSGPGAEVQLASRSAQGAYPDALPPHCGFVSAVTDASP